MGSKRSPLGAAWFLCVLAAAGSCSDDGKGDARCVDGDSACGASCGLILSCEPGLYCSEGVCVKECVSPDRSDNPIPCPSGGLCTSSGMCIGGAAGSGGSSGAGIDNPGGGSGGTVAGSSGLGGAGRDGGDGCPDALVRASRSTPTVMLLIDQSSSMTEDFGGDGSRWDVLRSFLLEEPDGLIADLQGRVRFGFAMYSAESGGSNPDPIGECPMITSVPPALDNYAAIASIYRDADVIEDTPTGDAIDAVIDGLDLAVNPDIAADPIVLVLATDGEPDRCEELDPQNGQEEAIAAVQRAFSMGVRTYIISVGDEVSDAHQQDMANAGLGRGPGDPDAEYWEVGDDASLRAALVDIVGSQLSCEVQLDGSVADGDACEGDVVLNGTALACGDPNGWELSTPRTIRLLGSACETLKSNDEVVLEVSFPCSVHFVD